jgi:serine/threonine protein kinase
MNEIEAMNRLKGLDNCISIECFVETRLNFFIMMKAINGGDLWDLIEARGTYIPEK